MQHSNWQSELANAIDDPAVLLDYLGIAPDRLGYSRKAIKQFRVLVPHVFADRINAENMDDPILRQVFPYIDEEDELHGLRDPLNEHNQQKTPGILHKYHDRALIIATGACAVHCRYCFRRHYPYHEATLKENDFQPIVEYIAAHEEFNEVILSGGDPLVLIDQRLKRICQHIAHFNHIKRIRIHSRLPVVLPSRINTHFLESLVACGKQIVVVLHVNHANEIDDVVSEKLALFRSFDIMLLNQSVLLKGVNDQTQALIGLSEALIANQVMPYYLHLLDPVQSAHHYLVEEKRGDEIISEMRALVSGYLVPRLVKELPYADSKIVVN